MGVTFNINLSGYSDQLLIKSSADMIALSIVLDAMDKDLYKDHTAHAMDGLTITSNLPTVNDGLRSYEIIKTFISIMRNVNDYIDKMVAVVLFVEKEHKAPKPMSVEEARLYTASLLDSELSAYNNRTKEPLKDKLKYFGKLPPEFVEYLTIYNILRNCYEHKKAIANKDLQIPIRKLSITSQEGRNLMRGKPTTLKEGDKIVASWGKKTINVRKGQPALISYEDLAHAEIYLRVAVPSNIMPKVVEIIKKELKTSVIK